MSALLGPHGFAVTTDEDLTDVSSRLGLATPNGGAGRSLEYGRVLVAVAS